MTWFNGTSDKFYKTQTAGSWRPGIRDGDARKYFADEFMAMRSRFKAKGEIIQFLFTDICIHLFSDNVEERNLMIRGWCLLDAYSRQGPMADYPLGYTAQNGPVPIRMASASKPYVTTGPAVLPPDGTGLYRWPDDWYRWALLALRAASSSFSIMYVADTTKISARPQYHVAGHKKKEHARSKKGVSKSCHHLLGSIFDGQSRWTKEGGGWDVDEFGCAFCDAHTVVFTYIALAEHQKLKQKPGLSRATLTPSQVGPLIEDLERQRYKYEDFWLLISQEQSQVHGFEDSGNAWAKKKLARLDFEEKQERDHHWSHRKLKVIKQEIATFKNESIQPAHQSHAENSAQNDYPASNATTATTYARLEINLSDSDDDLLDLCNHRASRPSTSTRHRASASTSANKRGFERVNSSANLAAKEESGELEVGTTDSDDDLAELLNHERSRAGSSSTPKKRGYEKVHMDVGRMSKKIKNGTSSQL